MTIRRGWLRICQQSYTKKAKLLFEFFFDSLHRFFQPLIRNRQRYAHKTFTVLTVSRTGSDDYSGLIEQAVGEFQ